MDFVTQCRQMLMLLAFTAALWVIHLYARILPEPALVALWAVLALGLARALYLRARLRRLGWLTVFVRPAGSLFSTLRGGPLMALVQIIIGTGLALLFLIAIVRSTDPLIWMSLLGLALLLPLVSGSLHRLLRAQTSDLYGVELAWRLASSILGLGLLVLLAWHAFEQSYPDFSTVTLEQAVWHMVGLQQARSDTALMVLQMAAAGDGLRLWLGQQLLPTPGTSLWQAVGWLLLLAQEAVFVWSYVLLCRVVVLPAPITAPITE